MIDYLIRVTVIIAIIMAFLYIIGIDPVNTMIVYQVE